MSSGFGVITPQGRCHQYYVAFQDCIAAGHGVNSRKVCGPTVEDYFECLHSKKQNKWYGKIRKTVIQKHLEKEYKEESKSSTQESSTQA
ncbi:NADH dehydrogenase (ubiquinone) Fe-S protein [Acrasis kona]|uniref:COX assembly mitochondrial protein n=1 Tax=Acrasis kona TaxID=1008807 RepID=A0AAW2YUX8_9EUKA